MSGPARRTLEGVTQFFRSSLFAPSEQVNTESEHALRRRRIVVVCTLVIGVIVHGYTLRLPPGDDRFYLGTAALAIIWGGGAWLSGPLRAGVRVTGAGSRARPWLQGLVMGLLLLAIFLLGALIVGQIPVLRQPVEDLLDQAAYGSLAVVAVVTFANGVVEELFYRGALFSAVPVRFAVVVSTVIYAAVTAAAGILLLTFAAVLLGLVTSLQRRATGGVLAPIVTHVVWSLGMLFLLPGLLTMAS